MLPTFTRIRVRSTAEHAAGAALSEAFALVVAAAVVALPLALLIREVLAP